MDPEDEKLMAMFMGGAQKQATNLGDLIMQKIREKESQITAATSTDPSTSLTPTRSSSFPFLAGS